MGVAEVFLLYADYFRMYVMYCNNMDVQGATVQRLRQTNPDFERFVQECKRRPECRLQDISSFLIKPFQRICRYPLLLEAIVRCSEPGPDTDRLKQAAAKIQSVVHRINQQKRQSEANIIAVELQERLYNPEGPVPALISPARKFVRHGLTYEVDPRSGAVVCYPRTPAAPNTVQRSQTNALCGTQQTASNRVRAVQRPVHPRVQEHRRLAPPSRKLCPRGQRADRAACPRLFVSISSTNTRRTSTPHFGVLDTVVFPRLGWRGSGLSKANSFWLVMPEFAVRIMVCFLTSEERATWEKAFADVKHELREVYASSIPLETDMDDFEVIQKEPEDDASGSGSGSGNDDGNSSSTSSKQD